MKIISFNTFILLLFFLLMLCACTGSEAEEAPAPVAPDSVEIPDGALSTLYAAAEGGTVTLRFKSSKPWTATVPDATQTPNGHFSVYKGEAGLNEVIYTAMPNTTAKERQTVFVVAAGRASLEITIVQPSLEIKLPDEEEIRRYLIRLYNETDGPNWRFRERWCSDLPIDQWGSSVKYRGGKLELWLTENQLKGRFDMSGCKALTYVKLSKNELTSVNVSNCPLLESMDLTSNKLTEVNISGCHSLNSITAGFNPLMAIDFSGHYAMRSIYMQSCLLTSLDVSDCNALEDLMIAQNSIADLRLPEKPTKLQNLWCYTNRLRSLDLTGCVWLEILNCGDNELTSLKLDDCRRLNLLYCYENNLTELNIDSQRESVGQFYCYSNRLTSLNVRNCPKLSQIHCADNRLTELDLRGCPDARWIICSYNNLSGLYIDPAVNMLNILDITSNNLTKVNFAPFGTSIAFCELYCRDNPIFSEIPERVKTLDVFEHDARFEYLPDGRYIDRGIGWWYPGEPQSGRHDWSEP